MQPSETTPRLNEKAGDRTLFDLVKDDERWAILLKDREYQFTGGDKLEYQYQVYLAEVVPVMERRGCSFKEAVNILHPPPPPSGEDNEKLRIDTTKEELKDKTNPSPSAEPDVESKAPPKLVEEAASSSPEKKVETASTEKKDLDKNNEIQEPKARNAETSQMEQKSESSGHRRKDSKAAGRSSSEPPTPKKEKAWARDRQEDGQNNESPKRDRRPSASIAIQTEEAIPQSSQTQEVTASEKPKKVKVKTPRGSSGERGSSSSSGLRQPLLGANPTTQTKGQRQKEKKAKQEADMVAKYEDCTCERAINSAGVRWLLICAAVVFMGTVLLPKPLPEAKSDLPHERPSGVPLHHSDEAGKSSHRVAVPSKPEESELKSAQKELKGELTKLDNLEEEQRKTQRVENLARLSQKENEDEARSQKKKDHLRQAALDAEVQAKLAMDELQEDQAIKQQQAKVKMAEEKIDDLEASAKGENRGQKSP